MNKNMFKLKNIKSELAKMQCLFQSKTKLLVARQVMQSENCALTSQLKMSAWIFLLRLWEHTGM